MASVKMEQGASETVKRVEEEEKTAIEPTSSPRTSDAKPDNSYMPLAILAKVEAPEKSSGDSDEKDSALAGLVAEKQLSLINAWEENEKAKAQEKAFKKIASIVAWENANKQVVEAELKKKQEELDKEKAQVAAAAKSKMALIDKEARERKATAEARRGKEIRKAEQKAAKFRATGLVPLLSKRLLFAA